jgi:hypothetical protein
MKFLIQLMISKMKINMNNILKFNIIKMTLILKLSKIIKKFTQK